MLRILCKSLKQPFDNFLRELEQVRADVDSAVLGEVFHDHKSKMMNACASMQTNVGLDSHQENPGSTQTCRYALTIRITVAGTANANMEFRFQPDTCDGTQ